MKTYDSQSKSEIVQVIEQEMKKRNWRQIDLATASGLPQSKISLLIKGRRGRPLEAFSLDALYKILVVLDLIRVNEQEKPSNIKASEPIEPQRDPIMEALDLAKSMANENPTIAAEITISAMDALKDRSKPTT